MKIVIAGGPKTGKTTLAKRLDLPMVSTDDYMDQGFIQAMAGVLAKLEGQDKYVLEGVQAARCLRAGLVPDEVIWLSRPHVELTKQQAAMAKGIEKVFKDWLKDKPKQVKVRYL